MCWECDTCRRNATPVKKTLRKRLNAIPVEEAAKSELECDPCLGNATWGLRFLRFGHLIGNLKGIKIYVFYKVILATELLVGGCLWRFAWFFYIFDRCLQRCVWFALIFSLLLQHLNSEGQSLNEPRKSTAIPCKSTAIPRESKAPRHPSYRMHVFSRSSTPSVL